MKIPHTGLEGKYRDGHIALGDLQGHKCLFENKINSTSSPVLDNLVLNPHSASQSSATTSRTSSVNVANGQGFNPLHPATWLG